MFPSLSIDWIQTEMALHYFPTLYASLLQGQAQEWWEPAGGNSWLQANWNSAQRRYEIQLMHSPLRPFPSLALNSSRFDAE